MTRDQIEKLAKEYAEKVWPNPHCIEEREAEADEFMDRVDFLLKDCLIVEKSTLEKELEMLRIHREAASEYGEDFLDGRITQLELILNPNEK